MQRTRIFCSFIQDDKQTCILRHKKRSKRNNKFFPFDLTALINNISNLVHKNYVIHAMIFKKDSSSGGDKCVNLMLHENNA